MKRSERLKKHGWNVVLYITGKGCEARKNNGLIKVYGTSITDLHKKVFGY